MSFVVRYGRVIAVFAIGLSYAVLAHYANTHPVHKTLGALMALLPISAAVTALAWHSKHRVLALSALGIAGAILFVAWSRVEQHFNYLYWFEHAGSQLLLCLVFGRTLRQGRIPMCTYFAKAVRGTITPEVERYSRQVTVAWTIFFGLMFSVSTVLFFMCPMPIWSVFANFFTAPLIGLMFVVEYCARQLLYPQDQHGPLLETIAAVWKGRPGPPAR